MVFSFVRLSAFPLCHWKLMLWKIKISCANSETKGGGKRGHIVAHDVS